MREKAIRTEDGRVVAQLKAGVLIKSGVSEEKHMLQKPPAWCFDVSMFRNLVLDTKEIKTSPYQDNYVYKITVQTSDTGKEYSVDSATFLEKCQTMDRGHNKQYMLPLQYWNIKGEEPEGEQFELF